MRHLLQRWIEHLANAYWLIPLAWLVGGMSAAGLLRLATNAATGEDAANSGHGALIILVVGSSLTVISMLLSGSLVALTLTTSQFGPRLLRNFLQDTFNKQVLGSYLGLAAFGLLLLLGICGDPPSRIATRVSVVWLIANLLLLVIFIHRLIQSMIVERVLEQVCNDIRSAVSPPGPFGPTPDEKDKTTEIQPVVEEHEGVEICWPEDGNEGYLLQIDYKKLARTLKENGGRLDLRVTSGDWLHPEQVIGSAPGPIGDGGPGALAECFADSCHLGPRRTPIQDERFAFERITEIALRALSPGIHDPFTAITCIERAGAELRRLAEGGDWPPPPVRDDDGTQRILPARASIGDLAKATFQPILEVDSVPGVWAILSRELDSLRRLTRGEDAATINDLRKLLQAGSEDSNAQ